jgi:hypothetical protein
MTATPSDPDLRVLHPPTGETIRILASGHDNGGAALEVDALLPPGLPGPPRPRGGRPGGAVRGVDRGRDAAGQHGHDSGHRPAPTGSAGAGTEAVARTQRSSAVKVRAAVTAPPVRRTQWPATNSPAT